jgi:hypothetical protein
VEPGPHTLEAGPQKLELTLNAGQTYFVAVAYNPGKSWAGPLAGKAFAFKEIDEATARLMLRQFRYEPPAGVQGVALKGRSE